MVVISTHPGGVMVSTLAWDARDIGSIPALGAIFHIFITPTLGQGKDCLVQCQDNATEWELGS